MNIYDKILQLAGARLLLDTDYRFNQLAKTMEEVGELASAVIKDNREAQKDAIGDVVVTLTILAHQLGLNIEECIEHAYSNIANRKGAIKNGFFIKEE